MVKDWITTETQFLVSTNAMPAGAKKNAPYAGMEMTQPNAQNNAPSDAWIAPLAIASIAVICATLTVRTKKPPAKEPAIRDGVMNSVSIMKMQTQRKAAKQDVAIASNAVAVPMRPTVNGRESTLAHPKPLS